MPTLNADSLHADIYEVYLANRVYGPHYTATKTDKGIGTIIRDLPRLFGDNAVLTEIGGKLYVSQWHTVARERCGDVVEALRTESIFVGDYIHGQVPTQKPPKPSRIKISRALDNGRDVATVDGRLMVCGVQLDRDVVEVKKSRLRGADGRSVAILITDTGERSWAYRGFEIENSKDVGGGKWLTVNSRGVYSRASDAVQAIDDRCGDRIPPAGLPS